MSSSDLDPYAVLNLPPDFTVDQLKHHYKALARQLHPDKCGGRLTTEQATATFQVLTNAYRALLGMAERARADRPFYELRSASRDQPDPFQRTDTAIRNPEKGFNIERFNAVFEQERMADPVRDRGYANWMRRNDPDRGLSSKDATANRQLIKYTEPAPMAISNRGGVQFTELGVERISDYSREDTVRHGIQYTDYRVAHTTTKLVDESVNDSRLTFNTLEELDKHRSELSFTMNDADARFYAEQQRTKEEAERRRHHAQLEYDARLTAHFERVHRSLLGI